MIGFVCKTIKFSGGWIKGAFGVSDLFTDWGLIAAPDELGFSSDLGVVCPSLLRELQ